MEGAQNNFLFSVSLFHGFPTIRQSQQYIKFKPMQNQDLFYARFSVKDDESRICWIKVNNWCKTFTMFDTGKSLKQIFTCY